jgi:Ca2+-binding EF-hand superfamily protein
MTTSMTRWGLALVLATGLAAPGLADHHEEPQKKAGPSDEERREAALRFFQNLDKNRDNVVKGAEAPADWFLNRFDRDGDDTVTKKELVEIIDRGPGLDRLWILRDPRARALNARNQFDQDKDGLVAAAEYPGDAKVFKKMDRNRDDHLEWKELVRLATAEIEDIRKRAKSPGKYDLLPLFDLNYDRKVTAQEYDGPSRSFRKYDENGDGVVDEYEIYPERRPMNMEEVGPRPEDLNVISTLDSNEDGRVSREEWKGSQAAWKRLDRNGDGWITVADAR